MNFSQRVLLVFVLSMLSSCSSTPTAPSNARPTPTPTPPALAIACPTGVSATTIEGTPVAVAFGAPTAAGGVAPLQISCTRQPGSMFTAGVTQVQCTVIDAVGRTASCIFNVTVNAVPPRLTKTRFLAFGDSLTAGELGRHTDLGEGTQRRFLVSPAAAYPTRLQAALRARYPSQAGAIEVINSGWPGEWAQDGAKRLEQVLPSVRPDVVIVLEGVNDIASLLDRGVTQAATAIERMAREARFRGVERILATLPPPRPSGAHAVADSLIRALNTQIRNIAQSQGAVLVDFYDGMRADPNRYISVDGLHPTEDGYGRMAELLALVIRANFELKTP